MFDQRAAIGPGNLDVDYLKTGLRTCLAKGPRLAEVFYDELFQRYPNARALFSDNMEHHQRMFTTILGSAAAELKRPDQLEPMLAKVGQHHRKNGVSTSHLEMGRRPFLAAIRSCIDEGEFADHEQDWSGLYSLLTRVMRAGVIKR